MADDEFIKLAKQAIDRTGFRHGRQVILGAIDRGANGDAIWLVQCDCGNQFRDRYYNIRRQEGCGCSRSERAATLTYRHGHARQRNLDGTPAPASRTYTTWISMRKRCTDPKHHKYPLYGGRGISVCEKWMNSFEAFLSDMGERPQGMTIDRIDSEKGYTPDNCRWAGSLTQRHNRRA